MLNSIWEDAKREFRKRDVLVNLILINVIIWVAVNLVKLAMFIAMGKGHFGPFWNFVEIFSLSSSLKFVILRPWGIFTSMFLHVGFMHILWNMLLLYWFGIILRDLLGDRYILPVYLLGGLAGGAAFFISAKFIDYGDFALGASAAVMAILMAATATNPNYRIHLIFVGPIKLFYVAVIFIFLDLIGISNYSNTGGHFAHIGGALMGWFIVFQLRRGIDLTKPVKRITDKLESFFKSSVSPKSRPKPKVVHKAPRAGSRKSDSGRAYRSPSDQAKLDAILDKIKESGYENLTAEEKEFLFRASKDD